MYILATDKKHRDPIETITYGYMALQSNSLFYFNNFFFYFTAAKKNIRKL